MRNNLKLLKKQLDDKERNNKAAIAGKVVEEAKALVEAHNNAPVLVECLNAFSNTKVNRRLHKSQLIYIIMLKADLFFSVLFTNLLKSVLDFLASLH